MKKGKEEETQNKRAARQDITSTLHKTLQTLRQVTIQTKRVFNVYISSNTPIESLCLMRLNFRSPRGCH